MPTALAEHLPRAWEKRAVLLAHPIYQRVDGPRAARLFMSYHVFCVWDFMSLLKSLQRRLTCVDVPWIPPIDRDAARLINEIVLVEESDEDGRGRHAGHYDLYLEAMQNVGADHKPIERFVNALRAGQPVVQALLTGKVPVAAGAFLQSTLEIALHGKTHEVAAAFFLGRENVIPEMFDELRASLAAADPRIVERLAYYLSRHVEIDADAHGPAAEKLLFSLCEDSAERWQEADEVAVRALDARLTLWDRVVDEIARQ